MHLKRIEMVGFKSFADKTSIDFDAGFTAIVGPNGSGKSNITEAIKWVLGEQSAKSLRGRKMDDVIFAGASNRKKAHYAQVSLIFDNTDRLLNMDVDEVAMTRRYTRSGESTYMINQKNCRLKDMTELMMDTGIGRDSFSIISQGQVEAVFTQKAEDRRGIFEEAAGVMKYKNRKKEAEKKLDYTQDNLHRINDILVEVEGRLDPLEKQKNVALDYQEKKAKLSDIEIALTAVQIETLNQQWEVAKKDLAAYQEDIKTRKSQQSQYNEDLAKYRQEEADAEAQADQLNTDYIRLLREAESLKREIDLMDQEEAFNLKDKASQEDALAQAQSKVDRLHRDLTLVKAQVHDAKLSGDDKKAQRDASQAQLESLTASNEESIEAKRQDYIDAIQSQSQIKNQISQLEKDINLLTQRQERFKQSRQSGQDKLERLRVDQEEKAQAMEAKSQEVADLLTDYQNKAQKLKQAQVEQEKLKQQKDQLERQFYQVQARKNSLESLESDHDGFYYGVRNALKARKRIAGIHGPVADLMTVPSQYVGAVETALGGAMQNIVTEDRRVASQVIQELKDKRGGRATFLPLDVIKGRSLADKVLTTAQSYPGFIGVMSDLVTYAPAYANIMTNLMGQTLVVDNLAHAQKIASALNHRQRIVTLERDVINTGGSMAGGANKKQGNGLLSRKQELTDLTKQLDHFQDQRQNLAKQVQTLDQTINQLSQDLDAVKEQGDDFRFQERSLQQELEQIKTSLSQNEKDLAAQDYDEVNNQKDLDQAQGDLAQAQEQLESQSRSLADLNQAIQDLNLSASEKQEKLQKVQAELQKKETDYAVFMEQFHHLQAREKQTATDLDTAREDLQALEDRIAAITGQSQAHSSNRQEKQKAYDDLLSQQTSRQKDLKAAQARRSQAQDQAQAIDKANNQLTQELESLYYKQAKLEAAVNRYEESIDSHLKHLSEDYGLTYERARAQSELSMSIDEASQKVRELKKAIDQLGPVNLAAIEEFAAVNDRYQFMSKQRDDVLAAKENLLTTMAAMDDEVSQRFKTTFEAVRTAFEDIFPKLFGGGKASLSLTDPSDLLHSGVEIVAQPPGKRLQHLSLLSGGEKALTAIALLFAILAVKKDVPFSILDEVEAALDEANVARYGRYLREFAQSTQFIVITHRKGTMEAANILYGVTMQESGVSKLASVRLEDFTEEDLE